jgi:hypothetical protein
MVYHEDHYELADPSPDNPLNTQAVDQIVVVDKQKHEKYIRLHPRMTAKQIRGKVGEDFAKLHLHCHEDGYRHYTALMVEAFPHAQITDAGSREAGVHSVRGGARFAIHGDYYWRAIAKIGFHYYLLNNRRGLLGNEPEFADIRRYIIKGGDGTPFFTAAAAAPTQIGLPWGEVGDGTAILPTDWLHVLAADETNGTVVVMVSLFNGPLHPGRRDHIVLGRFETSVPDGRYAHVYQYDAQQDMKYAGRVQKARIEAGLPRFTR